MIDDKPVSFSSVLDFGNVHLQLNQQNAKEIWFSQNKAQKKK